jgi:hypothetical protein
MLACRGSVGGSWGNQEWRGGGENDFAAGGRGGWMGRQFGKGKRPAGWKTQRDAGWIDHAA